ncbi:MAG: peptidoglycan-binding protein [Oscillospiraceae bacterium]|nr:peptidoglycan-binding protein [Oscillospiraceae bacterium]
MGIGFLTIHATTGDDALPVPNAHVTVADTDGTLLYEAETDTGGMTQPFEIIAPSVTLTLDPHYQGSAYATVTVRVRALGFVTEHIHGVEIVDTQTAILPVHMEPVADEPNPVTDNYIQISEIGLLARPPYQDQVPLPGTLYPPRTRALPEVVIPDFITVHLGAPTNAAARNIRVRFADYIKNVTSSEIFSTWPRNSLLANIHAIVTFALNRVFTEWYPSRGFHFDITNNTQFDMAYREGGPIFQSISDLVDAYFNVYIHRAGFINPWPARFCAGPSGACQHGGMSQWGTVTLANQGLTPLQILRRSYPNDIVLTQSNNIGGIPITFPGHVLTIGSSGDAVRRIQNYLNRIRVNFPSIPRIENPNGVFGADTAAAVREFQRINGLTVDGVVGRATWNRITMIFVAVSRLAELDTEGIRDSIGQNPPHVVLSQGSRGQHVLELQYILNVIAAFYDVVPTVIQDGVFDARTRNAVIEFQRNFGLVADGVVGPLTWNQLYAVYRGINQNVTIPPVIVPPTPPPGIILPPYPGTLIRIGATGQNVRIIQEYLNVIGQRYPNIPPLAVDGIFGTRTESSVIAFQREFGLVPDGIVGPITWGEIMRQYERVLTPAPPPSGYFNHTVVAGDTLWLLAQRFGTTVAAISALNSLTSDMLHIGQVLKIPSITTVPPTPPPSGYFNHTVVAGDTLWLLAQRFGTTVAAISALNSLTSDMLHIGRVLKIPNVA